MKKITRVLPLLLLLFSAGCASIIHGTNDKVSVNSMDEQAVIYVDGVPMGKGAISVDLKKGKTYEISARKSGCQDVTIQSAERFDSITLLGIFFDFGIFTITTDLGTGAAWQIYPTTYSIAPFCIAGLTDEEAMGNALERAAIQSYLSDDEMPAWHVKGAPYQKLSASKAMKTESVSPGQSNCKVSQIKMVLAKKDEEKPVAYKEIIVYYQVCKNSDGIVRLTDRNFPKKKYSELLIEEAKKEAVYTERRNGENSF